MTTKAKQVEEKIGQRVHELTRDARNELVRKGLPRTALALRAVSAVSIAVGAHVPGWSLNLGALTKRTKLQ